MLWSPETALQFLAQKIKIIFIWHICDSHLLPSSSLMASKQSSLGSKSEEIIFHRGIEYARIPGVRWQNSMEITYSRVDFSTAWPNRIDFAKNCLFSASSLVKTLQFLVGMYPCCKNPHQHSWVSADRLVTLTSVGRDCSLNPRHPEEYQHKLLVQCWAVPLGVSNARALVMWLNKGLQTLPKIEVHLKTQKA